MSYWTPGQQYTQSSSCVFESPVIKEFRMLTEGPKDYLTEVHTLEVIHRSVTCTNSVLSIKLVTTRR